jgi:hypothetical protein
MTVITTAPDEMKYAKAKRPYEFGSLGFSDGGFKIMPARVESQYPNMFRAARYPNGAIRIQGAYAWSEGNLGGVLWKDLPLVIERSDMHNISSPRTDDNAIEQEIKAKGKTAARVTPADIEANIASEHYFTAADGIIGLLRMAGTTTYEFDNALRLLTFCVLVLKNGFTVTGESACASPENFDAEIGKKIARENAKQKIWPLMGYELRSKLSVQ